MSRIRAIPLGLPKCAKRKVSITARARRCNANFLSGASEVHPHFTVVIGAERNELHSKRTHGGEIRMKNWDSIVFAQGVVVLAFDHMLRQDVIVQLTNRALRQADATVDVAGLK